jgi:hypothetical protein
MRLKSLLILWLLLVSVCVSAQNFGFEWIRPYQPYYKIKVARTGVYRISQSTLAAAGISTINLNTFRFQLFRNGVEQPLYIQGDADGIFDGSDYLEFLGKPNDGAFDSLLYANTSDQPHTWQSLFSDTAIYFLTILPDTTAITALRYSTVADENFGAYTAEPYLLHEERYWRTDEYVEGINLFPGGEKYNSSEYTEGEGWGAYRIGLGQQAVYQLPTPHFTSSGPTPQITVRMAGVSDFYLTNPPVNHHVVTSIAPSDNPSYVTIDDRTYKGYTTQQFTAALTAANIGATTTNVRLQVINDLNVNADFNSLLYIQLNYPRLYNLSNQTQFEWSVNHIMGGSKSRIVFQQYGNGTKTRPLAFDLTSNQRIRGVFSGGNANLLVKLSSKPSQLYLFDSTDVEEVSGLISVSMPAINPADNYEYLIVTHPSLNQAATAYEQYRSQTFNVLRVNSTQLYDYYTYGQIHPLAIRRFAAHLLTQQTRKPDYMLLLGKGYQNNYLRNPLYYNANLVPPFGVPASDVLLTSGITGSGFENDIATGRVAAATNQQALNYLEKLKYYETTPDSLQEWRKQILHVSGGKFASEQQVFRTQLSNYAQLIRGKSFGARVLSYNKTSGESVQNDFRVELQNQINRGISMMTFLGHGSATVLDVSFGSLAECNNTNKYPLFYFNGCNIGNASDIDPTGDADIYGRDFVCAANKGAIGWLAHSNFTLDGKLYAQMNSFYQKFCLDKYGQGIGKIISEANKLLAGNDIQMRSHSHQLTYQGDPAVRIYSPALPDYETKANDVFFRPEIPNAKLDSFAVSVIVRNLGRAIDDTVTVDLTRILPNGARINAATRKLARLYLLDTVTFWMTNAGNNAVGNNTFELSIDKNNTINEGNSTNNSVSVTKFIPGFGVRALLPHNFAIVTSDSAVLLAQNNDLLVQQVEYTIELDTSALYNSPARQQKVFLAGAVARASFALPTTDTTTYFWRVKLSNTAGAENIWDEYSFTHIPSGSPGWAQRKFEQYKQASEAGDLLFDTLSKQLVFSIDNKFVKVAISRWKHAGLGIQEDYFATPGAFNCVASGGVIAIVYDKRTLQAKDVNGFPRNCNPNVGGTIYPYYAIDTKTPAGRAQFISLIDSIETGDYIAMYNYYDAGIASWDAALRNALASVGSVKTAAVSGFYSAFAMMGVKGGAPGAATEDTLFNDFFSSPNGNDTIRAEVNVTLRSRWHTGYMTSKAIGPANAWSNVRYNFQSLEMRETDRNYVSIYAVNRQNKDSLIAQRIQSGYDISWLDATIYPYVKLSVLFVDSQYRSPNQFGHWMVSYIPSPEGAFNAGLSGYFYQPALKQGDSLRFSYAFQNISTQPLDSLPVRITITDANRLKRFEKVYAMRPLQPGNYELLSEHLPTDDLRGAHTLTLWVNENQTRQENSFINNVIEVPFTVEGENKNPNLEVTFDGYRILNGDFVSPVTLITVTSTDKNPFRLQNDTAGVGMWLRRPGTTQFEAIPHHADGMKFYPATDAANKARLEFKPPQPLADGMYTLRVQSRDKTGNTAGRFPYEIDFKVENKSSITHFLPYPNPGTTNIRFVFTLTGSKPPEQLLIRIMTISGKVIREINQDEFGPVKIGQNISQFAWDGTDRFGDRLANGVYLYQVFTRIGGTEIEKRTTAADKYFLHDTGKIYLLR